MANKLIIVESPAKAKTIGKFLGRGYKVEASQGHIRDLPKSKLGVDVENGFEPQYITIRGRGDILAKIRKEAKSATKVYLATDPDREGEAISWHLAHALGIAETEPCRIEFNEITSKAVKAAVDSPRTIDLNLVDAQQARRVLDRLVGYKISPLLWQKVRKGLSAGRVQSVATKMICDRENEIEIFEPEEYWIISTKFKVGRAKLTAKFTGYGEEKLPLNDEAAANAVLEKCEQAQRYVVVNLKSSERKKQPASPFTTSLMQQEASRKLGFTTQKTMQVAQQLYEGVELEGEGSQGLISYIRTDSTRIADEAIAAVREYITENYGANFLPEKPNTYKTRATAQDAHEAIRPTDVNRKPADIKASLTKEQYKLYKLVHDRFVASQMNPAVYDTESADFDGDTGVRFHFSGQRMRFPGFTSVYVEGVDDAQEEADINLPELFNGMELEKGEFESEQHFTMPPPRYTEASLVRTLEEKGIGRPSTYAPTISTIISRGYVTKEQKRLLPTELGNIVNELMCRHFEDIVDITFTADMESRLDEIEGGRLEWHKVIADFYEPFEKTLEVAEASIEKVDIADQVSDIPCEKCGALLVYKMGRFGKFLACPNFPECRYTQAIPNVIGVKCPKCGAELLERISRKGRKFFGCEKYPDCDFVSWERPVNERCPQCGSYMVLKRGAKDTYYHICSNEACKHKILIENGGADDE